MGLGSRACRVDTLVDACVALSFQICQECWWVERVPRARMNEFFFSQRISGRRQAESVVFPHPTRPQPAAPNAFFFFVDMEPGR